MATITNLDVNLFARTAKFDKPIVNSKKKFQSFTKGSVSGMDRLDKKMKSSSKNIVASLKGIALKATAAALAIKGIASSLSQFDTIGQQLRDFTRFGLDVESFGTFSVLARKAKVDVDRLVDTSKDLSIRIGEASLDGKGDIFDSFNRLNLDVNKLKQLKPEAQLIAFSDALSKVKNETERLAITDILLSDAGTEVLNVLSRGSVAFTEAAKEADQLGLNIDKIGFDNIIAGDDALKRVSDTFKGLKQKVFSGGLGKAVKSSAGRFAMLVKESVNATGKAATQIVDNIAKSADDSISKIGNTLTPSGDLQFGSQAASTAFLDDRKKRGQDFVVKAVNEGTVKTVEELKRIRKELIKSSLFVRFADK